MKTIDLFAPWAKKGTDLKLATFKRAVVYTRVSSKEQRDENLSLDWQKKAIEEFAGRNQFEILEYFGGTYESATTDGRKEFLRMLEFVKKNKRKVTHILVYLLDRFSRTGGEAIKLAKDLREKYDVTLIAVSQPIDTSNPGGVFQQNMQLLFSEYDNMLRRQRAIAGITEKLERGIWCKQPPMGYSVIKEGKIRKIVINEVGKKLRKAFEWKAMGMKNEEIIERLRAMGVKIYKQKLSMIFSNPFYCGIIANTMLKGKVIEGVHEPLISQELFLTVNNIRQSANKYGVPHKMEIEQLPLKMFIKCPTCNFGYTGYVVKKRNIYYYKCRTKGCCANKNAEKVNEQFNKYLLRLSLKPTYFEPLMEAIKEQLGNISETNKEQKRLFTMRLNEVQAKIDTIEEKFFITGEMSRESFEKFAGKYQQEKQEILNSMTNTSLDSSNLQKGLFSIAEFSMKLPPVWSSSPVKLKEKLQNLIFPNGLEYDMKKEVFRTFKTNLAFQLIADLHCVSEDDKNEQGGNFAALSSLVG